MIRRMFLSLPVVLLAIVLVPSMAGTARAADDEAAIGALWEAFSAATVAGDAEAWLALWDDEAIQMPPGEPARDKAELAATAPEIFAAYPVKAMASKPEETVVDGDWAYSRGSFDMVQVMQGKDVRLTGKFLTVLKRQDDGSWKIYRDMFNSNGR